jgi:general secretion pathway protein G
MMSNQSVHTRSGFSLMEIMIVVMIVGLFIAVGGGAMYRQFNKAKKTNAKAALNGLKNAVQSYYDDTYQYPQTLNDLLKSPSDEKVAKKWDGPYLDKPKLPRDPWGKPYQYHVNEGNAEHPYELLSYGGPKGKGELKKNNISVWDEE